MLQDARCAAIAAALWIPGAADAQASSALARSLTGALALGIARQPDERGGHLARLGPSGRAALGWRFAPRAALAVELALSSFAETEDHVHAPCPDPAPFACHEPTGPLRVGSLGLALSFAEAPPGRPAVYLLAGAGWHRALAHPTGYDAARPGLAVGAGLALPRDRLVWSVEVRHQRVHGWDGGVWSLTPITLGLTF